MRLIGVIVVLALLVDLPLTASLEAQAVSAPVDNKPAPQRHSAGSPLLADCPENVVTPSPLSRRPVLRRATYAAKPSPSHRHRARTRLKRHRVHVHHAKRKAAHPRHHAAKHHHRPIRHKRAPRRPIVHRVTYASPLCGQRSEIINDMLGLPGITQPPVVAESATNTGPLPLFINLPPVIGTGPGPIVFPGGPIYPGGPGPIIISPPGPPVGPPVAPPISSPVPEPAGWATMLIGLVLVGGAMRRRAATRAAQ